MCGFSMFPVNPEYLNLLQESLGLLSNTFPEEMSTFTSCEAYLNYTDGKTSGKYTISDWSCDSSCSCYGLCR